MNDWPVGLSTGCFYQKSIFDCLEPIRESGFSMIEICSFPAHLDYHDAAVVDKAARLIQRLEMEPYSFHAPFADYIDITAPDRTVRSRAMDELMAAVEAAAALRVRYFVIHPGPERNFNMNGDERFSRMENTVQCLNAIGERCHQLNIGCVLENKLPHLIFGNTRDLLWILGAMKAVNVRVCLDTGHAYLAGDLFDAVHKFSSHMQMIHASDNGGSYDDHFPPGQGRINWTNFLNELSQVQFCGGIILELSAKGEMPEILAGARKSRSHLREISRRLTLSGPPAGQLSLPPVGK